MSKTVACIIARTVSTRLPLKVLRTVVDNISMLDYIISRLKLIDSIDEIYVCTSTNAVDDILIDVATKNEVNYYRGSEDAVIERMIAVGDLTQATNVIRITGDNVFTSTEFISKQIEFLENEKLDYVRLVDVPIGSTAEVISLKALKKCNELMDPAVSEYLMLYIFEPNNFSCGIIKPFGKNYDDYSITVDTPEDLKRTKLIFEQVKNTSVFNIELKEILHILENEEGSNTTMNLNEMVKYPFEKMITFQEFKNDMVRRKEGSKLIKL